MAMSKKRMAVTALGVTTTALAAAAGAYWLYGAQKAKNNRKVAKGWMLKARGELMDLVEKTKDIDKKKYFDMAESVAKTLGQKAGATTVQISGAAKDLKAVWAQVAPAIIKKTSRSKGKK
jgi:hypothetical protein